MAGEGQEGKSLVQYVIVRRDLKEELLWPMGSIIAQACHASTAAIWESRNDGDTQCYLSEGNIEAMHKVVLEIKGREQLEKLSEKLSQEGVAHKLWNEQPENFPTCIATKPCDKGEIGHHFKKLKLCK